ncbi:SIMPL domain-containing protein [Sphingomonas sp. LB-2]|uniref:SIMPL domain-containing protein n=1 Tax=Sphingomonas caeni TaxID=2984949 RepID=UPI00222F6517|nr:SIMPL domain-containing protein [Sphingomonas caeni]MCW3846681.1 SIMPL domain-containing protein [Sphingomonas caeni]
MRALILGLAAAAAVASLPAQAQVTPVPQMIDGTVLEVSAEGRTTRVPDLAIVQAGVTTQAPTAGEAYAQANAKMARVIAALRAAGVAERDIQTSNISLSPQYRDRDNQPPVIFAYQASNSVTVRFRDISKAGTILDTLVREGANTISGPNLTLAQPDAAMDEARVDAIGKARARAELYAKAAGLRVDRILTISEGGASPMPIAGIRMGFADKAEVMPGEQEVNVTVTVRFLLK